MDKVMIDGAYETYCPSQIPNLVFDDKDYCLEFEQALKDLLENEDWKVEWEKVTKLAYSEVRRYDAVIDLFEDPLYTSKFNKSDSPMIENLLYLSEYAVEVITENENIDSGNTYYPVLCFLYSRY